MKIDATFKVGPYRHAEVLTAMVKVGAVSLFLVRILPGRWCIQRGSLDSDVAAPVWDGRNFADHGPRRQWNEDELEGAIESAAQHLIFKGREAGSPVH